MTRFEIVTGPRSAPRFLAEPNESFCSYVSSVRASPMTDASRLRFSSGSTISARDFWLRSNPCFRVREEGLKKLPLGPVRSSHPQAFAVNLTCGLPGHKENLFRVGPPNRRWSNAADDYCKSNPRNKNANGDSSQISTPQPFAILDVLQRRFSDPS